MNNTEVQTILLIEDNPGDIRLVKEMLNEMTSFNYQLIIAETLKDGCEQIRKNHFVLILLDLNLPDSTGKATFDKVVKFAENIPVVLVSGLQDEQLSLSLIKEGAQDYILKQELNSNLLAKTIQYALIRKNAEVELQESEQRYHNLFHQANEGLVLMTMDGKLAEVNQSFAEMHGYSVKEIKSIDIKELDVLGEDTFNKRAKITDRLLTGEVVRFEVEHYHKDGHRFFMNNTASLITIENQQYFLAFHQDITERKQAEEELKASKEQLSNFAANLQLVREEERVNLAREIHDDLAQLLVALKMDMGMFKKKISKAIELIKQEEVIAEMEQLICQVDHANKSARGIINGLRPEQLELLGFVEAAEVHLSSFEQSHHIKCSFKNTVLNLNVQPDQAIALFRILQESLNNILKHAMAKTITVQLSIIACKLVMEISDNGIGFDVNIKCRPDSYGLIGMKERIKLLGGNLDISSKMGEGTSVRVEIPYGV